MKTKHLAGLAVVGLVVLGSGSPAHAALIWADNFDSDSPGLNLTPTGWSISNGGTVDIIGNGNFGITCAGGSGVCIDLDGSTGKSGNLVSPSFNLVAGQTYTALFDLSGNQRIAGQTDIVAVNFGGTAASVSLLGNAAWNTYSATFMPGVTGAYNISFLDNSSDNVGAILDNVSVQGNGVPSQPVPEPATMLLFGSGLAAFAGWRLKK